MSREGTVVDGISEAKLGEVILPMGDLLNPLSLDQKRRILSMFWVLYGLDETDEFPKRRRREDHGR